MLKKIQALLQQINYEFPRNADQPKWTVSIMSFDMWVYRGESAVKCCHTEKQVLVYLTGIYEALKAKVM